MLGAVKMKWLGSLRERVKQEISQHLATNPAIQDAQQPLSMRMLRGFYRHRGLLGFLVPYLLLVTLLVATEIIVSWQWPTLTLQSSSLDERMEQFLKDVTSYLLGAQVVMVGLLFPIAVGLVTLIAQREDASSTVSDIQVYYNQTLAYQIGASGIALSIVLATQLFWPAQFVVHWLGYGILPTFFEIVLTAVHLVWLLINFSALWHFLQTSLSFMRPAERALLRRRFAANVSIPNDLSERLTKTLYVQAEHSILGELSADITHSTKPSLLFGTDLGEWGEIEVAAPAASKKILVDLWQRPLRWAVRSWLKRCRKQEVDASAGHSGPTLTFLPNWRRPMSEEGIICRRNHGVPLNRFERFLIRKSFRFGRE